MREERGRDDDIIMMIIIIWTAVAEAVMVAKAKEACDGVDNGAAAAALVIHARVSRAICLTRAQGDRSVNSHKH